MEMDRRLRYEAATNLRKTENVRKALLWIAHNPKGFTRRVSEFEKTVDRMNELLMGGAIDTDKYGHLANLKPMVADLETIETPKELSSMYDDWIEKGEYEETADLIQSFFTKLNTLILTREWKLPTSLTKSPNKLATALLVEGYGLLLEHLDGSSGIAQEFVHSFKEVLVTEYPDFYILEDIIGWMAAEKDAYSPKTRTIIEKESKHKTKLQKATFRINSAFRRGNDAYDVVDELRMLPRPIAVDFNNVIADSHSRLLNPEAPAFLRALKEIGNVVIVTAAADWKYIHDFLVKHGLWTDNMVLMTSNTYEILHDSPTPKQIAVLAEYTTQLKKRGITLELETLIQSPSAKRIAPLFCKSFDLPIIDDSSIATESNPGMLGITVQYWTDNTAEEGLYLGKANKKRRPLQDAVEIVRNHYGSIAIS